VALRFLLVRRFFVLGLLITARFFAPGFGAAIARGFITGNLDAAQGATEVLDFAFVVEFLAFGQFDEFLDLFH
jgi:hypothetical protein